MKHLTIVLAALISLIPAAAQTTHQQRASLELDNVTVWLGEPKAEVEADCKKVGYVFDRDPLWPGDANKFTIITAFGDAGSVYDLEFKAGKLVYADRLWKSETEDHLAAVMGAIETLDGRNCRIKHRQFYVNDPANKSDHVFLDCGRRSVLIVKGKSGGKRDISITEMIGTRYQLP